MRCDGHIPEYFSAVVLTQGTSADDLADPLAADEDVSVMLHRRLEGLVGRDLRLAAEKALQRRTTFGEDGCDNARSDSEKGPRFFCTSHRSYNFSVSS